ncbi:DNA repair protein XRCC4 [Acrasis kona]|uniref:DNA repair protein XRCC4 n=1 Tax=Acrasis kona TaxID=1008807 RepID=A0AAW2ZMX0_9EUKA
MVGSIDEFTIDGKSFIIKCNFQEDDSEDWTLDLTVSDGSKVWFKRASFEEIKTNKVSIDRYSELLKESLVKCDKESKKYVYSIRNEGDNITLLVKFILKQSGQFTAAEIPLNRVEQSASANMHIFSELLNRVNSLEQKNIKLAERANERDEAISLSKQCVIEKDNLESIMYSQFLRVLNEKKDKIRDVENKMKKLKDERELLRSKIKTLEERPEVRDVTSTSNVEKTPPHKRKSEYVTPHKRRNAKSMDAEDLLDDLLNDF